MRWCLAVAAAFSLSAVGARAEPPAATTAPAAKSAPSRCQLGLVADFKVKLDRFRPLIEGRINGQPVQILVDTGAFTTTLWTSAARELHLRLTDVNGLTVVGAGGRSVAFQTVIENLQLGGLNYKNFHVLVTGSGAHDAALIMGRDILGRTDIEFDLAHDALRLLIPKDCRDDEMPYWAAKGYSQAPIRRAGGKAQPIELDVQLNGRTVQAILDSGAALSIATPAAASRSGVKLDGPQGTGRGIGPRQVASQIGVLDTFTLGDETIRKAKIRFADLFKGTEIAYTGSRLGERPDMPEMLLGADFLRSHRVLVSPSHRMVFFTYEGGPVFDVTSRAEPAPEPVATPASPAAKGAG